MTKCSPSKIFRNSSSIFVALYIAFATIAFTACSNSETMGADIEDAAEVHCKDVNTNIFTTQDDTTTKNDSLRSNTAITELASKDSIHIRTETRKNRINVPK